EEELAVHAVDEPLHRPRPLPQLVDGRLLDGDVVVDEVELRDAGLREEDLVRIREPHLAARDLDRRVVPLRHRGHLRHYARRSGPESSALIEPTNRNARAAAL